MAQPYSTGPCAVFVGVGTNNAAVFLGHSMGGFKIHRLPEYEPFMNDLGGTRKPFDQQYMGQDCLVVGVLNRYKEGVWSQIRTLSRNAANVGADRFGELGSFMVYEGKAHTLWLQFPYATKPAFNNAAFGRLASGRRFIAAFLQTDEEDVGTRAKVMSVAWYCQRVFVPATGDMIAFDGNMQGLPVIT